MNNPRLKQQIDVFKEAIRTLQDVGALKHVIVVGSWAEYVYQESNALNFRSSLKTHDMDLLVPNINRPRETIDLVAALERQGFELRQSPEGLMKFDKDGLIDVEFLAREIGQGQIEPYKVNSLGVTAQGLRNMDILTENTMTAHVDGFDIIVPRPEAYVLHKLVINEDRKPDYKKEKDIEAVKNVLKAIIENPQGIDYIQYAYGHLTAKQQFRVQNTCQKYDIELSLQKQIVQETAKTRSNPKMLDHEDQLLVGRKQRIKALTKEEIPSFKCAKRNYLLYSREIIAQNKGWSGCDADIEIVKKMLIAGNDKTKIKEVISNYSPETFGKTLSNISIYVNDIIKKALTPAVKKEMGKNLER
jgi:hypothetical protein